jgi:hypothetical protein
MPFQYWNRYTNFLINGEQTVVPFVPVPSKTSDKNYIFIVGQSRLDKVSQQFYASPYFGWLIMAANPQYSGNEYSIPDGAVLTIPYPLVASLQDYKNALENYFFYYGR